MRKNNRKLIRLRGYDYSRPGFYFVTICTKDKVHYFGEVKKGMMHLSPIGAEAKKCWENIPEHYPVVKSDAFVIMPDHVQGIINITHNNDSAGAQNSVPVRNEFQHIIPRSLGAMVRGYKIGVTKWCRQNGFENFKWHRNFYESIIRDDVSLGRVRRYIIENPQNWKEKGQKCWIIQ